MAGSALAWDGALCKNLSSLYVQDTEISTVFANSVIEIQAFLVEIISKFELTMTDRSERVCRAPSSLMAPMVDGELECGAQLPLVVSVAAREDVDDV